MNPHRSDRPSSLPDWIRQGRGIGPSVRWTFPCEAPLTGLCLARETGEVLAADQIGSFSGVRLRMDNDLEAGEYYYIDNVTIDYVLPTGNHTATFTENGAAVSIASADSLVTDGDSANMASGLIKLTNASAGDQLLVNGSAAASGKPGGQPSITQPIAGPCDSPKLVTRNRWPKVDDMAAIVRAAPPAS